MVGAKFLSTKFVLSILLNSPLERGWGCVTKFKVYGYKFTVVLSVFFNSKIKNQISLIVTRELCSNWRSNQKSKFVNLKSKKPLRFRRGFCFIIKQCLSLNHSKCFHVFSLCNNYIVYTSWISRT
jgi:hypothetical protein